MKTLIKELLRESLLDEEALRLKQLPKEVALFVKPGTYTQLTLLDPTTDKIYGMIDGEIFDKNYAVGGVASEKGFGPFMYELMLMLLDVKGKGLMPSRDGDIRKEAFNIWHRFYLRNDIKKDRIEPLNSDGSMNKNYRIDILTGEHSTFHNSEEFGEYHSTLNKMEKNTLEIFNCVYFLAPNNDFSVLIKRGINYENNGYPLIKAVRLGNEYFSNKYSEAL